MISKFLKINRNHRKVFCCVFILCLWVDTFQVIQASQNDSLPYSVLSEMEKAERNTIESSEIIFDNGKNFTKPNVPKCCNLSYGFTYENKSFCVESENEFLPDFEDWPDYSETAKKLPVKTRYEYFIGDPCSDGKYILDPEVYPDDKYSLYSNATLLYLDYMYSMEEFCLETLNGTIRAFVCFGSGKPKQELNFTIIILYAAALLFSVPFLLATAIVYLSVDMFRDLHGKSLSCHVLCLAIGYLVLATVQLASDQLDEILCIAAGFTIQFFFTASFFWLNVICFNTWRCINADFRCIYQPTNLSSEKITYCYYSIYGWYAPTILSIITLIMDIEPAIPESFLKPNFGLKSCWFYSDDAALPYFYGPVGIVILINLVLFSLSVRKIFLEQKRQREYKARNRNSTDETREILISIRLYTKTLQECIYLFCIMGINWTAEIISWAVGGSQAIWITTDIFNALQGVTIFYLFVVKPLRVRNIVKRRLRVTWKKLIKCDCRHEPENRRQSRHWHASFFYEESCPCSDNENHLFLSDVKSTAV